MLLAAWGPVGEVRPTLAMALELQRRGHAPAVATAPQHRAAVTDAGLAFYPLRPALPEDGLLRRLSQDGRDGLQHLWHKLILPALHDACDDLMAAVAAVANCRLLVSHPLTPAVRLVAERLGLPWLATVLRPSGLEPIQGHVLHWLPHWLGPLLGQRPEPPPRCPPQGVLALFPPELCPPRPDHPPATRWTGFPCFPADEPLAAEVVDFLDHGQPPLVFSLGTGSDACHTAALAALRLGRRAVLLTGGEPVGVPLPASMLSLPQAGHDLLLPRAAAVIHHGDLDTTTQALCAGRPQLILPRGADSRDLARRCRGLGVARVLDGQVFGGRPPSPRRLAATLAELLADAGIARQAGAFGQVLAHRDGATAAADAIEQLLAAASHP